MNTLETPDLMDEYEQELRLLDNAETTGIAAMKKSLERMKNTSIEAGGIPESAPTSKDGEETTDQEVPIVEPPLSNFIDTPLTPSKLSKDLDKIDLSIPSIPGAPRDPERVEAQLENDKQILKDKRYKDNQSSELLIDASEGPANFGKQLKALPSTALSALEAIASPLMALGDASSAPIAYPSQKGGLEGIQENFETSWEAFKGRMFPELGQEHEQYGLVIAKRYLPDSPDWVQQSVALTIELVTDPTLSLGIPLAKIIQKGLKIARQQRLASGGTGGEFKGLIQEGLHEILGVGKQFDPTELDDIAKLAVKADHGDRKALMELNIKLKENALINAAVKVADDADVAKIKQGFIRALGDPKGPTYTLNTVKHTDANLRSTLTSNNQVSAMEINLANTDSIEDVHKLIETAGAKYIADFNMAAGTDISKRGMAKMQKDLLQDLIGTKVAKMPAEEAYKLRHMIISSSYQVKRLLKNSKSLNGSALDILAFNKALAINLLLQERATGITGRATALLNSFKISKKANMDAISQIKVVLKATDLNPQTRRATAELMDHLDDPRQIARAISKIRWWDAPTTTMFELYSNLLLSGPITHAVNIASNGLNLAWSPTESFLQGMFAAARGDFIEAGTEIAVSAAKLQGMGLGFVDAFRHLARKVPKIGKSWDELNIPHNLTGHSELEGYRTNKAITAENYGLDGIAGDAVNYLGRLVRSFGALLVEEDIAFKVVHYNMEKNAQAIRKAAAGSNVSSKRAIYHALKNNPDEHMVEAAIESAKHFTFTNDLGKISKHFDKVLTYTIIGKYFVPYFKTPTNIVKMGTRNSFVGNIFYDLGPALTKGGTAGDVARAKLAMGAAIPAAFMSIMDDRCVGHIDMTTPEGRFRSTQKQPAYSCEVGGEYLNFEKIEPVRTILGMMFSYREALRNIHVYDPLTGQKNDIVEEIGVAIMAPFIQVAGDTYMLQAIGGALDMLEGVASGDIEYAGKHFKRVAAAMTVPNAVRQFNSHAWDDVVRKTDGYLDMVKQGIPGLSRTLPSSRTLWGDEQLHPEGLGPDLISPITTKVVPHDKVDDELIRLEVPIPRQTKKFSYLGENLFDIELNPKQSERFAILLGKGVDGGPTLKEVIWDTMQDPAYDQASDIDQRAELKKRISEAIDLVRDVMMRDDAELQDQWDERNEDLQRRREETLK